MTKNTAESDPIDLCLTEKQAEFCIEFSRHFHGERAAIAAGYSPRTARVIASENLRKPNCIEFLRRIHVARDEQAEEARQKELKGLFDYGAYRVLAQRFGMLRQQARGGTQQQQPWSDAMPIVVPSRRGRHRKAQVEWEREKARLEAEARVEAEAARAHARTAAAPPPAPEPRVREPVPPLWSGGPVDPGAIAQRSRRTTWVPPV